MARRTTTRSGNGRLEEALAALIQNQATFLGHLTEMDKRFARMDERFARMDERFARMDERFVQMDERMEERFARTDERFARIEAELETIKAILLRHEQMLEALPEAIRKKIGFKRT
jgi:predicted nuclease with TOPRIM domain